MKATRPLITAYAWRDANFLLATVGGGSADFEQRWARLLPLLDGMYLSFETDTGPDTLARAFPPAHLRRLRDLKRQWDPTGLFRDNFFVDPTITELGAGARPRTTPRTDRGRSTALVPPSRHP